MVESFFLFVLGIVTTTLNFIYMSNHSNNMDWLGVASLGVDALGSVLGISAQNAALKKQFEYNRRLQELAQEYNTSERIAAQQYNKEMLDYTNAYNTPLAQRKRLQDAGYNPYMSNVSAGTSGSTSISPQSSTASNVGLSNIGTSVQSSFSNMANIIAQRQKVISESNRNDSETNKNNSQSGLYNAQKYRYDTLTPLEAMSVKTQIDNYKADTELKQQMKELQSVQAIGQKLSNKYQEVINKYVDKNQQLELLRQVAVIQNAAMDLNLKENQCRELVSRCVLNYAHANNFDMDSKRVAQDVEFITRTMQTAVSAENWENRLRGAASYNQYSAEKKFGYGNAYRAYRNIEIEQRTQGRIYKGRNKYYNQFDPVSAFWYNAMGDAVSGAAERALPLGLMLYGK